jgi:hypothetical protein
MRRLTSPVGDQQFVLMSHVRNHRPFLPEPVSERGKSAPKAAALYSSGSGFASVINPVGPCQDLDRT